MRYGRAVTETTRPVYTSPYGQQRQRQTALRSDFDLSCPQGHLWAEHGKPNSRGYRECQQCRRDRSAKYGREVRRGQRPSRTREVEPLPLYLRVELIDAVHRVEDARLALNDLLAKARVEGHSSYTIAADLGVSQTSVVRWSKP